MGRGFLGLHCDITWRINDKFDLKTIIETSSTATTIAGRRLATLIFVVPIKFEPMAIIIITPVAVISIIN